MQDTILYDPHTEARIYWAAMWLLRHPEVTGIDLYRHLGDRFGLSAAAAAEARELTQEIRDIWPPRRRKFW